MKFIIRKAEVDDAKEIADIVESVSLDRVGDPEKGFLAYNKGEEGYSELIKKSEYCYVAVKEDKVVAFLVAYPNDMIIPDSSINKYFYNFSDENFVYIFQIAVLPEFQGMKIGECLYERLFEDTKGIKKMVISSAEPYNKNSEQFHLRMGFKKIDKIRRDEDNGLSFVYEKI